MRASAAFTSVIEPSAERIPLLEILHVERHDGRDFIVSSTLKRVVLTEFDLKLSRHLAAISGTGFPALSVDVWLRERDSADGWQRSRPMEAASLPHALAQIARRALADGQAATLRLHHQGFHNAADRGPGLRKIVRREDVEVLERALAACRHLGETAFMDISGDFDFLTVQPHDQGLAPIVMDLHERRISIPPVDGVSTAPVGAPLYDFDRLVTENPEVRAYLATLRHGQIVRKEAAVQAFRAAAEKRIADFDAALSGRTLDFHRLDGVISLVTRLKAGLGDDLKGLSEDARLRAFDWAAEVERQSGRAYRPAAQARAPVALHHGGDRNGARPHAAAGTA